VQQLLAEGKRVGWLPFELRQEWLQSGARITAMPTDPAIYSALLYAVLHDLDEAGVDRIVVAMPPHREEWLAVHDRLWRAALPG
jgi:hypothetical protein